MKQDKKCKKCGGELYFIGDIVFEGIILNQYLRADMKEKNPFEKADKKIAVNVKSRCMECEDEKRLIKTRVN